MTDKIFVDTNILIYAHDIDAKEKHQAAKSIMESLWKEERGVISTQVLLELYINVTRKLQTPLSRIEARSLIEDYSAWELVVNDEKVILHASHIEEKHQISFWDAMIVAAAYKANAGKILSEDLNPGQVIEGMKIENPFFTVT